MQLVKKFPAFLWNPNVPYRTHKCLPPVPILSQLNPVPTTPSNFLKIHLIILPSISWSPQWPLSLRLPPQHPVHTSILPHTRHMPCPSHSSRFYDPHHTVRQAVTHTKRLITPSIIVAWCAALQRVGDLVLTFQINLK